MERNRIISILLLFVWLLSTIFWLHTDRLLRDGDEEGHVGAAELLKETLQADGAISYITNSLAGSLGEYPPLYASFLGGWWSLFGGLPSDLINRSSGILLLLITATATGWLAKQLRCPPLLAFFIVLFSPLLNGMGRHFMIEGFLCATTALFAAILFWSEKTPRTAKSILLGAVFAFGMLSKQSFILTAFPLFFFVRNLRNGIIALLTTAVIAMPWYISQLSKQQSYLFDSIFILRLSWALLSRYLKNDQNPLDGWHSPPKHFDGQGPYSPPSFGLFFDGEEDPLRSKDCAGYGLWFL